MKISPPQTTLVRGIALSTYAYVPHSFGFTHYHNWGPYAYNIGKVKGVPHIPCPNEYPACCDNPVNFLRMLNDWAIQYHIRYGRSYDGLLLVLNEPDQPRQCKMLPASEDVYRFYLEIQAIVPKAKLTLPQVSQTGTNWLATFLLNHAENLRLNGVNICYAAPHVYNMTGEQATAFLGEYRELVDATFGMPGGKALPLVITEWGATTPDLLRQMYPVVSKYDNFYYTEYYGGWQGSLLDANGRITEMGRTLKELMGNPTT